MEFVFDPDLGFLRAMTLAVILSGIPLVSSMVVGFVVSVLQAATQIQEQTLSFVPKLLTVVAVMFFAGGWMSGELIAYLQSLFDVLPALSRMS